MSEWKPIKYAPRDGTKIRLRNDEGGTHTGTFAAPHWWMIARGARIADGDLYNGEVDIMRAVEWQELGR